MVQDRLKFAEHEALNQMVDRSRITRAILTADRGYESYNIMAHLQEKRWLYLIRVRDIDKGGIISRLDLPGDEEFDLDIDLQMTKGKPRRRRKNFLRIEIIIGIYRLIQDWIIFPYAQNIPRMPLLPVPFRVVRFKITHGQYETVVTNLSASEFPALELKKLYAMRWGIETSFRTLKYNVGMIYFHSVRKDLVLQNFFQDWLFSILWRLYQKDFAAALKQEISI